MTLEAELVYGTCVSLGDSAAILQGASGSGKSDLALRFIFTTPSDLDPALVADDQINVEARQDKLFAHTPQTIEGQIEVRGIGIVNVPYRRQAEVKIIVKLAARQDIPRMPPHPLPKQTICGVSLPILLLYPFEPSAALKLRLALQNATW